jgi:Peroxisomal biogenesis factor 11 (PEX11)
MCRLLTTTAGLETFLSTVNYALYILAFFEARSPSRLAFLERLNRLAGLRPSLSNKGPASHIASSQIGPQSRTPFKTLGTLISETRTVLRLTALLPLYAWLRQLCVDNESQDSYLRIISLTQCFSYIIFQFLENVAFLSDRGVVSQKWLAKRGRSAKWWLWSSRAWFAGVSCDFLILFRKALIEQQRRSKAKLGKTEVEKEEEKEEESEQSFDRRWWSEMFVASCWLPLSLHYSLRDGLRGMNPGAVGLLGFMAGMQSFAALWARTESS